MKVRKLDNKVLAVLNAASTDETRYVLQSVHIREDGKVEATNGVLMLQAQLDMVEQGEIPGSIVGEVMDKEIIVPAEVARQAVKQIPKSASLPILEGAYIVGGGIQSTDLETTHRTNFKPIEGVYPPLDNIIPAWRYDESRNLMLNPKVLKRILKASKVVRATSIVFTLPPEGTELSGGTVALVINNKAEPIVTGVFIAMSY